MHNGSLQYNDIRQRASRQYALQTADRLV